MYYIPNCKIFRLATLCIHESSLAQVSAGASKVDQMAEINRNYSTGTLPWHACIKYYIPNSKIFRLSTLGCLESSLVQVSAGASKTDQNEQKLFKKNNFVMS